MSVALVADLESSRYPSGAGRAEYIETFDENGQVDFDQDAVLFDRVVLEEIGVDERDTLCAFGVLAAYLQAVLESTKNRMLWRQIIDFRFLSSCLD